MAVQNIGENVQVEVKGDKVTITIDLAHRGARSASGKTVRVASTMGNIAIAGTDVVLGLNAYTR